MSRRAGSPSLDRKALRRKRLEDPYFGQEEVATLCENFVTYLFECPELPPNCGLLPLKLFIAKVICRARLPKPAIFAALFLLERLKTRLPNARGPSGHRLFVSTALVASKLIVDDSFSNGYWVDAACDIYSLKDLNQMERELLGMVDYDLSINHASLLEFEVTVRRIFSGPGPYIAYALPHPSVHAHRPFPEPKEVVSPPFNPFGPLHPATTTPSVPSPSTSPMDVDPLSIFPSPSVDSMKCTPELSDSMSTSPSWSIVAPATPAEYEDPSALVISPRKEPIPRTTAAASQVPATAWYLLEALWGTATDVAAGNAPAGNSMIAGLLTRAVASVW